ncbi:MAG: hypothetical protein Q4B60_05245 [Erysipelotrichaceae bacterium]|nr:hypothetical protein [Erysipelotrichaceae bacterium]
MKDQEIIPFYGLLNSVIDDISDIRAASKSNYISNLLRDNGVKITPRSIQRYRSGESVPSFEIASKILDVLGAEFSVEYIQNCLKEGKRYKSENDGVQKTVYKKITINSKDINIGDISIQDLMSLIEERVNELYPEKNNGFSYYVEKLIEKDLLESIVTED